MIYLDNAATSFPKPAGVSDRMKYYLDCIGAPVNRSVYGPAQEAAMTVLLLRELNRDGAGLSLEALSPEECADQILKYLGA